jgi:hypothetical protein
MSPVATRGVTKLDIADTVTVPKQFDVSLSVRAGLICWDLGTVLMFFGTVSDAQIA